MVSISFLFQIVLFCFLLFRYIFGWGSSFPFVLWGGEVLGDVYPRMDTLRRLRSKPSIILLNHVGLLLISISSIFIQITRMGR